MNPLQAGLVASMKTLDVYKGSGHALIMGHGLHAGQSRPRSTQKYLPQHGPSYFTVLLNMTDVADGLPFTPHSPLPIFLVQTKACTRKYP